MKSVKEIYYSPFFLVIIVSYMINTENHIDKV